MSASQTPTSPEPAAPVTVYSAKAGSRARLNEGALDLLMALRQPRLWSALAVQDVKARYRGSMLGPWWITISMAALISGMSVLYSELMNLTLAEYVPWMCCGIVLWGYLSATITEGCDSLVGAAMILRQTPIPTVVFMFRTVVRNLIVLAHNMIIVAVMMVIFDLWPHMRPLEFLAGTLAASFVLLCVVVIVSIISARYRDIPQVVTATLQVLLFLTPVFWRPDQLPREAAFLLINPAFHLIEVMRAPLIGGATPTTSWLFIAVLSPLLAITAFLVYAAARRRIVHFL